MGHCPPLYIHTAYCFHQSVQFYNYYSVEWHLRIFTAHFTIGFLGLSGEFDDPHYRWKLFPYLCPQQIFTTSLPHMAYTVHRGEGQQIYCPPPSLEACIQVWNAIFQIHKLYLSLELLIDVWNTIFKFINYIPVWNSLFKLETLY